MKSNFWRGPIRLRDAAKHIFRQKEVISSLYIQIFKYNINEQKSKEKYLKLTTLKMDTIFKTSKTDELRLLDASKESEESRSINLLGKL